VSASKRKQKFEKTVFELKDLTAAKKKRPTSSKRSGLRTGLELE